MRKITVFKKSISIINATFILLTLSGCSKNNKDIISSESTSQKTVTTNKKENYIEYNYDNYLNKQTQVTDNSVKIVPTQREEKNTSNLKEKERITTETTTTPPPLIVNENKEVDYFENSKIEIRQLLDSQQYESAKSKAKEVIKTGIDFIFYDTKIKGISFDELKEESKKVTYENLNIIDGWIMEIFPNYKEELEEKYQFVSGFISEKYYSFKNQIIKYLGEEDYNSLIDIKDKLENSIQDGYENAKEKTKNWYNRKFN